MSSSNEHDRHISMLRAAIPYVSPESRHAMEILLQADTLIHLAQSGPESELSTCGLEAAETDSEQTDPISNAEALLIHIREFCTPKESETISLILNFIHADRLFKSYKDFTDAHPDMLKAADISQKPSSPIEILFQMINGIGSITGGKNTDKNYMLEFLMSQLNPEQKAIFEQYKNIMYN